MATVQEEMAKLRANRGLTVRDTAQRCDLHFATISKAESTPVRWETIHTILVAGYNVRPGSKDYESIKEMWLAERLDRRPTANPLISSVQAIAAGMDGEQLARLQGEIEKAARRILRG
jgi:transcriptional regulator with XRE-family HTH domain